MPLGTTYITQPFQNSGSIQLWGFTADLTGGSIANSGSIQGNGLVNNAVNNTGTIESIEGTLTLSGSLQNAAGGLLAVDSGSKLFVSSGLAANLGTINLTGGVFDNNGFRTEQFRGNLRLRHISHRRTHELQRGDLHRRRVNGQWPGRQRRRYRPGRDEHDGR